MKVNIINFIPVDGELPESREVFDVSEKIRLFGLFSGIGINVENCTEEEHFLRQIKGINRNGFDSAIIGILGSIHSFSRLKEAVSGQDVPIVEIFSASGPNGHQLIDGIHGKMFYRGEVSYILALTALSRLLKTREETEGGNESGGTCLSSATESPRADQPSNGGRRELVIRNGSVSDGNLIRRELLIRNRSRMNHTIARDIIKSEKISALREFSAGIAHELNNIFAPIVGYAQILSQKAENQEILSKLKIIEKAIFRASDLINDLFEFTRLPALELASIDINDTIGMTLKKLSETLRGKEIVLDKKLGEVPRIMGDKGKLGEVLEDILLQAVDSMPRGGVLSLTSYEDVVDSSNEMSYGIHCKRSLEVPFPDVRLEKGMRVVVVRIRDSGEGFEEKDLERICYPFYLLHDFNEVKRLNISKSYGIVLNHGGALNIQSVPGKGSLFTVLLPVP